MFRAVCYSPCALGNLLKSRTKQAFTLSATGLCVWLTRCSPSVCLCPWEMGWCHRSDGPIPFISVKTGAWLMDRKCSRRNNNICRIYFRNIRPLSLTVLISANRNGALILIYGRVYSFAVVGVALTWIFIEQTRGPYWIILTQGKKLAEVAWIWFENNALQLRWRSYLASGMWYWEGYYVKHWPLLEKS